MTDAVQVILLFVIIVLSFFLIILGIQVFIILRELKTTISKANKVLDDTGAITGSVSGPISALSTIASGVKVGSIVSSFIKGKFRGEDSEKKRN